MKISKIVIENYTSFSKSPVESLLDINMIYGYNNSGKSNLLKFIELLFRRKIRVESIRLDTDELIQREELGDFWTGIIQNEKYMFRNNEREKDIKFKVVIELLKRELVELYKLYPDFNKEYGGDISMELNGKITARGEKDAEIVLELVKVKDRIVFSQDNFKNLYFQESMTSLKGNQKAFNSLMGLLNDSVLLIDSDRYFIAETEDEQNSTILTAKTFKNWLFSLSLNPEKYNNFMNFISFVKNFEPSLPAHFQKSNPLKNFDVSFARFEGKIQLMLTNSFNRLPLDSFGTGIQQIIYILAKIFEAKPKIVLIEEIELNLSPKYQCELIQHFLLKFIQKGKILDQLFFTTHSPLFCYRNDLRILQIEMNNRGESLIKQAKGPMLEKMYAAIKDLVK